MRVHITGTFTNSKGETRFVALAESDSKKRTGFGATEEAAKHAAEMALQSNPQKRR